MEWIKTSEKMPEEKEYFSAGVNHIDGKDRIWTESDDVLVVDSGDNYYVDCTKNGTFMSERHKDCDGFTHYVIAWMPIPKFIND